MKQLITKHYWVLALGILLINLIQGASTELIYDEAYYWYFAQNLAFGYFDHPPMMAFLIKIGMLFFKGELGVRLIATLLGSSTYLLLWSLIDSPKKRQFTAHFYVVVFSMALLNAYGFLILPDTPLLFFTAVYLSLYKKFLTQSTATNTLLLGLCMAALLYSKYNGVLIIVATIVANPSLVTQKRAWLATGIGVLAFSPHLWWLSQNNWVTISYHLFERPKSPYSFTGSTLGYFLNLMAVLGFIFPWVYWALLKTKSASIFEKTLKSIVYTVLLFFFISSFKQSVQAQWVVVISIPLSILTYQYLIEHPLFRKWFLRIALINMVCILYLRLGMAWQPLLPFTYESHGNKAWVAALKEQALNRAVVFQNSYQNASMYAFYSGMPSYSLNTVQYRKNQYSIDDSESKLQGEKVVFIQKEEAKSDFSFPKTSSSLYYGTKIDSFVSLRKLQVKIQEVKINSVTGNSTKESTLLFSIYNPYSFPVNSQDLKCELVFLNRYKKVLRQDALLWDGKSILIPKQGLLNFEGKLTQSPPENAVYYKLSLSDFGWPFGLQGETQKIDWKQN